jgi:predicted DNA repair protein MutK
LLGVFALPRPYDRIGSALALAIALIFLVRLWRHEPPTASERPPFIISVYVVAVFAELLGMYTAALLLPRFGAQQQVYPAVGCIVGLHFIGLWLATRSPRFLHITAGMCLVSLLSMILPFTWNTIGLRYLLLGAGNAVVLWVAASGSN